jgi:hypothetical protein
MAGYYANITLAGPSAEQVFEHLRAAGGVAYVAGAGGATVVFHEDLGAQERLAAALSAHFRCPALVVMAYGESILLYELYESGTETDAYVSSPHEGLELDGPAQEGDAARLSAAFGIEMDHKVRRVERVLRTPTKPNGEFALAVNRHGELAKALGLPLFAAGTGYGAIELGELPEGPGFDPSAMRKTGGG